MITTPTPSSKTLSIANHLLNKSVKKKFGDEITIRINSLKFMYNRSLVTTYSIPNEMIEEITLKSKKRLTFDSLKNINDFLINQLNILLLMIELEEYKKVLSVILVIV